LKEDAARDAKRAATMQGEVAAVLQRMDQAAAKVELVLDAQKRVDQKLETLTEQEEIRREQQKEFLERVNGLQQDHEHTWKDWAKRFDIVERQSEEIGVRLKDVETTDLAVRRAQRAFDELVEKITRRVNELNEVQRLGEQRLRQEWSTHQADSQKRWSNFVLSQEEQQRELERQRERMAGRVTEVEDRLQDVQDTAQHLMEQIERYLQSVLEATRDSLNEGERFYKNPG
jgi:chromosome segregation ATPase